MRVVVGFWRVPVLVCVLILISAIAEAEDNRFRNQFITNYKTFQFKAQENLIKESKGVMPGEVLSLVEDAMIEQNSHGQRMFLLDAAAAMASGLEHYHGGGKKLIKKIDKLIKKELKAEKARVDELLKWKKEERFLGNFVMNAHEKEMEAEGLAPVIYPHWVHRIWFECKVCHQSIFVMKRWRNQITQEKILEGKQCGVCHNGEMAFGADKNCARCHIAGKSKADKLHNINFIDHKHIREVAARFGAKWNIEKSYGRQVPVDKYGFIDWLELKRKGIFQPIHSIGDDREQDVRENKIVFRSKSKIKDVLFDHEVHSSWIKCDSCHPEVFEKSLTNNIKMRYMAKGQFCGHCHGKVSFTFADCRRCHSQVKGSVAEGALLHQGVDADKSVAIGPKQ